MRTRVEEVIWSSRFRVAHKVAARFREGNVFLCGDAAHVHSPAGGQGMNTGIQDAANLAWKLALVLRGHADEGAAGVLLDSYEAERRQVALGVVSTTHRLTRLATVRSPVARHLRNALLAVAGLDGRLPRRLAANLAEVDIVYPGGWSADGSNTVERWIPEGGRKAAENQDPASGPASRLLVPEGHEAQVLDAAARFPGLPVRVVPVPGVTEASLVRPDGYVAGRSGAEDSTRLPGLLAQALGATPPSPRPRRRCGRDIGEGAATLLDLFRAWHYTVRELIEATAEEAIRRDDPYDRESLPTGLGMGRVTLLGDAHPPDNAQAWTGRSPGNRGQGGAGAVPQGAPRRRPRENSWRPETLRGAARFEDGQDREAIAAHRTD